jgi:ubiquinone/menaquinone biosynthesis C-methylase UbiE
LLADVQRTSLEAVELRPDDRLLDVGCGTGAAVRKAAATVKEAIGVDVSSGMVTRARELAADIPNVEFLEAESGHLPFDDGAFTAVLCTTSFHHYPDPLAAATEMARVLGPAGRLVIGDPARDRLVMRVADRVLRTFEPSHVHMYRLHELGDILYRAGFSRVATRQLHGRGYGIWRATR